MVIVFQFGRRIRKGFSKLSAGLQEKLSDAHKFASATVDELKTVPEDILSAVVSFAVKYGDKTICICGGKSTRAKMFSFPKAIFRCFLRDRSHLKAS